MKGRKMRKRKFTPGNWYVDETRVMADVRTDYYSDEIDNWICEFVSWDDAFLIANAKNMLEMLNECYNYIKAQAIFKKDKQATDIFVKVNALLSDLEDTTK